MGALHPPTFRLWVHRHPRHPVSRRLWFQCNSALTKIRLRRYVIAMDLCIPQSAYCVQYNVQYTSFTYLKRDLYVWRQWLLCVHHLHQLPTPSSLWAVTSSTGGCSGDFVTWLIRVSHDVITMNRDVIYWRVFPWLYHVTPKGFPWRYDSEPWHVRLLCDVHV